MTTPNLNLPELPASDPNKFVEHNSILRYLATLSSGGVEDIVDTPPGSPSEGDLYLVGKSPTGAFVGQEDNYAYYVNAGWEFISPVTGSDTLVLSTKRQVYFDGTNWECIDDLPFQLISDPIVNDAQVNITYGVTSSVNTFNLPEGTKEGDRIILLDYDGSFETSPLILSRSGTDTINNASQTGITLSINYLVYKFLFSNGIWRLMGYDEVLFGLGTAGGGGGSGGVDVTYYVANSTGNDSNDGLTTGTAFQTLPKAVETLDDLDLSRFDVTIELIENYTAFDSDIVTFGKYQSGGGKVTLKGDTTTRRITLDASYSTTAVDKTGQALINITNNAYIIIEDLEFDCSNVGAVRNALIRVKDRAILEPLGTIKFLRGSTSGTECIGIFDGALLEGAAFNVALTMEGTTANPLYHFLRVEDGGKVDFFFQSMDINPNFPGDLNVIASGGAAVKVQNASGLFQWSTTLGNQINGVGSKYEIRGSSFFNTFPDLPGTATNNISTNSILA